MADPQDNMSDRVGIDVSATTFRAVALDTAGVTVRSLSRSVEPGGSAAVQLIEFINELRTGWGAFDRIGISVPGLVDPQAQRVAFSIHIPEHSGLDIVTEIRSATGVNAVIENDVNAAAY